MVYRFPMSINNLIYWQQEKLLLNSILLFAEVVELVDTAGLKPVGFLSIRASSNLAFGTKMVIVNNGS